jgi:hypothetical protein
MTGRPPRGSDSGLGNYPATIETYQQTADRFRAEGARCSVALCLFKIAECQLPRGEPWHAIGYLAACPPFLHVMGLTGHETLTRNQLEPCQTELTRKHSLGSGGPPAAPIELGGFAQPAEHCRSTGATRVGKRSIIQRFRKRRKYPDPRCVVDTKSCTIQYHSKMAVSEYTRKPVGLSEGWVAGS